VEGDPRGGDDGSLERRKLTDEPYVVLVQGQHPSARTGVAELGDLAGEPLVNAAGDPVVQVLAARLGHPARLRAVCGWTPGARAWSALPACVRRRPVG